MIASSSLEKETQAKRNAQTHEKGICLFSAPQASSNVDLGMSRCPVSRCCAVPTVPLSTTSTLTRVLQQSCPREDSIAIRTQKPHLPDNSQVIEAQRRQNTNSLYCGISMFRGVAIGSRETTLKPQQPQSPKLSNLRSQSTH